MWQYLQTLSFLPPNPVCDSLLSEVQSQLAYWSKKKKKMK